MKKQVAAVAMGAALLGGGGLGAALMAPTVASADSTSTAASSSSTDSSGTQAKPGAWVGDALKKLVDAGTITQAQSDAVQAALDAARPAGGPGGPGRGGPGLDAAATALGMEAADLRTALEGGKTVAEVAKTKGVDLQKVVDAIVTEMNSHLAQAVTDGRLTQAQADEMKANATERATALVNGEQPDPGSGPPPGAPAQGSSSSSSSQS